LLETLDYVFSIAVRQAVLFLTKIDKLAVLAVSRLCLKFDKKIYWKCMRPGWGVHSILSLHK